jgi:hypothetical protein
MNVNLIIDVFFNSDVVVVKGKIKCELLVFGKGESGFLP